MGASRQSGLDERIVTYPVVRDGNAFTTDPTSGTVVADSGEVTEAQGGAGVYEVTAIVSSTAQARVELQHRNAENDATLGDAHPFICGEGNTVALPFRVSLTALGQRVRLVMSASLTGDLAANLIVQRVG